MKSKWKKSREVIDTAFEARRCGEEQSPRVTRVCFVDISVFHSERCLKKDNEKKGLHCMIVNDFYI